MQISDTDLGFLGNHNIALFVKIDSDGNIIWKEPIFPAQWSSSMSIISSICSMQKTNDGGYIFAGNTNSNALLVKIDNGLNIDWINAFDGIINNNQICSVQQTNDNGYIIIGKSIIKTNANGNLLWNKSYTSYSGQQTSDGNYVLLGSSSLMKIDSNGDKIIWNKSISSNIVQQISDNGYITVGESLIKLREEQSCSENINPLYTDWGSCSNGQKTRTKYFLDLNYDSCCAITRLSSDCNIDNGNYLNVTETQSCSTSSSSSSSSSSNSHSHSSSSSSNHITTQAISNNLSNKTQSEVSPLNLDSNRITGAVTNGGRNKSLGIVFTILSVMGLGVTIFLIKKKKK